MNRKTIEARARLVNGFYLANGFESEDRAREFLDMQIQSGLLAHSMKN